MSDFPLQKITIFHKIADKTYKRYNVDASLRNTTLLNQKNYGFSSEDNAIIRIFDIEGYSKNTISKGEVFPLEDFVGDLWEASIGDVIVNGNVNDEIKSNTPHTELSKKYGKDNVLKVNSINLLIFDDEDIEELNHVKLGCV